MRDNPQNTMSDRCKTQVLVPAAKQMKWRTKDFGQPGSWVCAFFGRYSPSSRKRGAEVRERRCER